MDIEKAKVLAKAFVKVHSNDNIPDIMRKHRDNCLRDNPELLVHRGLSGSTLDNDFFLKRAILGSKQTSPGKDDVCYEMVKHLSDTSLYSLLSLFNRI